MPQKLVNHLRETLPLLPDQLVDMLQDKRRYGIPEKDARILVASDDGVMLEFYMDVVHYIKKSSSSQDIDSQIIAKLAANWYV